MILLLVLSSAACGEHEFEPPDPNVRGAEAAELYSTALFDSISWPSDTERAIEGNAVFSAKCRQCHGPLGRGETEYAADRDLEVPSLVDPEWGFDGDHEGVRRRIFVGHPNGMPIWGVAGITPREIDATAFYLLERLRPEVLGSGLEIPGGR